MSTAADPVTGDAEASGFSPAYRNYVLALVVVGFILNFLDRQILTLLMPALKEAFQVSDASLGFLSGFAFAAFYVTLGLPLAHLADQRSRRTILSASIAVWSAMTALCGAAQTFWHLALARFGVGAGEAGFSPAALSMLADYFPPQKHAGVIAIASLGLPLGVMTGLALGSVGLELFGWRGAFLLAGAPGIVFALLFYFTVREPPRTGAQPPATDGAPGPGMWATSRQLFRSRTYALLVAGNCATAFGIYGVSTWVPSLLVRSYGIPVTSAGYILALILGGAGCAGLLIGGLLTDRFTPRHPRFGAWLSAAAAALALVCLVIALGTSSAVIAIPLIGVAYAMALMYNGPITALIYVVVPATSRAFATGLQLFCVNFVGLGIGPFAIGLLSDLLAPTYGAESLRYAMLAGGFVFLISLGFYIAAARSLARD